VIENVIAFRVVVHHPAARENIVAHGSAENLKRRRNVGGVERDIVHHDIEGFALQGRDEFFAAPAVALDRLDLVPPLRFVAPTRQYGHAPTGVEEPLHCQLAEELRSANEEYFGSAAGYVIAFPVFKLTLSEVIERYFPMAEKPLSILLFLYLLNFTAIWAVPLSAKSGRGGYLSALQWTPGPSAQCPRAPRHLCNRHTAPHSEPPSGAAIFYLASEPACKGLGHHGIKGPLHGCHGCNEVLLWIAKSTETVIQAWEKVEGDIRISGRYQGGLQLLGIGSGHIVIELAVEEEHWAFHLIHPLGRGMGVMLPEPWQIEL
jgi:hypothetical protein